MFFKQKSKETVGIQLMALNFNVLDAAIVSKYLGLTMALQNEVR